MGPGGGPDAGGKTDYLGAAAVVVFLSGITFAFIATLLCPSSACTAASMRLH
jgi:hypothetical protein